jgi:toluene monooxygenase system protein E
MNESINRPMRRRTFSAFGDVRKMPSEYEIVTHGQNWTMRDNRPSAFEQNPSSPPNLWFLTYRDQSRSRRREQFPAQRQPDYRMYVNARGRVGSRCAALRRTTPSSARTPRFCL